MRLICLVGMLAVAMGGAVAADDTKPKPAERERGSDNTRKLSPELQKEREKRRDDFKKLTPEEREAKRKELKARLEKRLNELRSKATSGGLSSDEKRELSRREQILKRFEQAVKPPEDKH